MVTREEIEKAREQILQMCRTLDMVEHILKEAGRVDILPGNTPMSEQFRIDLCYFLLNLTIRSVSDTPQRCYTAISILLGIDLKGDDDLLDIIGHDAEFNGSVYKVSTILETSIEAEIFFRESHLCENDNLPKRVGKIFGDIGYLYLEIYEPDDESQIRFYEDYLNFSILEPITYAGLNE